jgi:hypothetical protein
MNIGYHKKIVTHRKVQGNELLGYGLAAINNGEVIQSKTIGEIAPEYLNDDCIYSPQFFIELDDRVIAVVDTFRKMGDVYFGFISNAEFFIIKPI